MYVNIDGQLKSSKRIELSSDSATILIHTERQTGMEEVFKCPSDSPIPYHLRNFFPQVSLYLATLFVEIGTFSFR